jgi:predicted RNA-binding protein with PIN domain
MRSRFDTVTRVSDQADPDLPDRALQSALEFAVGIAAAGAKLRPQLPFPTTLKRFLRFHKLPPTALAQVRAAVESDDEFRGRLASVATAELVDQVGVLWLSQPDGWAATAAALASAASSADDQPARHREERRRLAAEELAARTRAELLALGADLDRAKTSNRSIADELNSIRAELADVRKRLRDSQRAEHRATQQLAAAQAALIDAQQSIPAAIDAGPTETRPPVDVVALHRLLDDATTANHALRGLLAAAADVLAAPCSQPAADQHVEQRPANARRQPIRLPRGMLDGAPDAVEFLLRTRDGVVLVDGYNVAMLAWPGLDLDHQRDNLTMAVENLAKRTQTSATIIFDGANVEGAHTAHRRRVRVMYSPAGVTADDIVRAQVLATPPTKPVIVVTNDRQIIDDVRADGANTVSSDAFIALIRK